MIFLCTQGEDLRNRIREIHVFHQKPMPGLERMLDPLRSSVTGRSRRRLQHPPATSLTASHPITLPSTEELLHWITTTSDPLIATTSIPPSPERGVLIVLGYPRLLHSKAQCPCPWNPYPIAELISLILPLFTGLLRPAIMRPARLKSVITQGVGKC